MGYGGIDQVEVDIDFDYFYVHREGGGGGYWNRYNIDSERAFLDFILEHDKDIDINLLQETTEEQKEIKDDFDNWLW